MRWEPSLVPGHYLILCFPKSTRQTFSPSFSPESTSGCLREDWFDGGAGGSRRDLSQEQPWPIPPCQPGEEGRSVALRKEIPPLQRGGFNPWFTETSVAYAMLLQRRVWKFPAQHQTIENLKQYSEPIHQMRSHSSFQFFSTARSLPLGRARKAPAHGAQHERGPKRAGPGAPTHRPHPSPRERHGCRSASWVALGCHSHGDGADWPPAGSASPSPDSRRKPSLPTQPFTPQSLF